MLRIQHKDASLSRIKWSFIRSRYRDFQGTFKRTRPEISPFEALKCS